MKYLFFLLGLVFLICYSKVPFLFFQQDEILGFGQFMQKGWSVVFQGLGSSKIIHFVPVTMSLSYLIYHLWGANYIIYNTAGLFLHLINGLLLYKISLKTNNNKVAAFIAVALFLLSSQAGELVMWPVISLNTISLTFALLAWLSVLRSNNIWLICILFLLSVFSLEYSIGISLFLILLIYFSYKGKVKQKIFSLLPFLITLFAYLLLRLSPILIGAFSKPFVNSVSSHFSYLWLILLVPKYVGQLFFGQNILLSISAWIQKFLGLENMGTAFSETNIYPILLATLGMTIIFIFVYYLWKLKIKNLTFGFLFIIFSAIPFILVPNGMNLSTISSRYMYFGMAGIAYLLSIIFMQLKNKRNKKTYWIFLFLVLISISIGAIQNIKRSENLYNIGILRQKILKQIMSNYPKLSEKTVFYMESNLSYFGLSDDVKILPFQSGLGQTLLVFYGQSDKLPVGFYPGRYLWEIDSQGYYEEDNRGFGYYRDLKLLNNDMKKHKLPKDSIIAFQWNGQLEKLIDITDRIRRSN